MKKSIWLSPFLLLVILSCMLFAQTYVLKVKVQVANVRMEPDTQSEIVKKFPLGTLLESKNKLGDWYEIVIRDEEGNTQSAYIHHMVVDVIAGETPQPEPPIKKDVPETRYVQPRPMPTIGDYPQGGFKILGGLASANMSLSDIPAAEGININNYKKSKLGFFGGAGYEIGSQLSFEANVLYMQKGVKFEGSIPQDLAPGTQGNFSFTSSLNVISIPLLVKYRFMPGNTPYVLGGGEFSLIMSHNVDYEVAMEGDMSISGSEDAKDSTNDIDYGLVFGAGFEMNKTPIPILIELRYHLGLADIAGTDPDFEQVTDEDTAKTSALIILVGIKF